jgi:2-keto-4-pentenoate hydratase/2-oxohepta-3-ene-1,7-dioic acid hydratase in catechol pathway
MKIVVHGPERRSGVIHADTLVVDASLACAKWLAERKGERHAVEMAAVMVPADLQRLIERGDAGLDALRQSLDWLDARAGDRRGPNGETIVQPLADAHLHAPRPRQARIACAGGNYADHHLAMAQRRPGGKQEAHALTLEGVAASIRKTGFWGFWKIDRDCLGPGQELRYPARATYLDYEGEAAIVLGKSGRDIDPAKWRDHVWGVTLLNDWSVRQQPDTGRMNFAMQKNFDGSCALGPCILVGADPTDIDVTTHVRGELRQRFNSSSMVFSFAECLAFLSRDLTLHPGDIVSGGTAAGTAQDSSDLVGDGVLSPEKFLRVGDVVEVASPQIGVLRNTVVA